MQYLQRKLQRSVMEMRKFVATRPKVSMRGEMLMGLNWTYQKTDQRMTLFRRFITAAICDLDSDRKE
jgi:hypothetical protein